ncbi:platelet endothelial aggregation receptor 1-like isoform X2 [Pomacea canaliculata]|uniref:platelet endothelial aggregation receptor 1-like isoform X2 n=1 Tax=Pomacea canaliculata TaxID=400727 RepID=UPI000D7368E4|nr:platelet endothelial aggregation receptor 1-like isoform X2 [Pomacea canaliculata]
MYCHCEHLKYILPGCRPTRMTVSSVLDLCIKLLLLIIPACLATSTTPAPAPVTCPPKTYNPPTCTACGQCAGGAQCDVNSGICHSGCQPGYMNSDCKTACPNGFYGNCTMKCGNCKDGVPCDKVIGSCSQCNGNYQLPLCTVCNNGFYDDNCSSSCGQCKDGEVCNKATGSCSQCRDNYQLPLCKDCIAGQWGAACGQRCGQCGGDGECNRTTGQCLQAACLDGWTGDSCSEKCPGGSYGPKCSKSCSNCRGNSNCRHDNGLCEAGCSDGFEGVLCDEERVDLRGAVAGSVMGAAVLISASVVGILVFLHFRSRGLKYTTKGVRHNDADDNLENAGYSDSPLAARSTPGEVPFYDPLDPSKRDLHLYEGQAQSGHNVALPLGSRDVTSGDATYQNVDLPQETSKYPKGKRHVKGNSAGLPENVYGNT